MAAYSVRVKQDIARWVEQGLIPAQLAETLSRDVEQHDRKSLSFGSVLAMMAALLVGAAILVLIAANWEAFPRLLRVGLLFATILAGYVGGAVLKTRDQSAIGEALYIIAAAAFGASIALIGQMYHMSGDESDAVVTWCVGHRHRGAGAALQSADHRGRGAGQRLDGAARHGLLDRQLVPASVPGDGGAAVAGVVLDRQHAVAPSAPALRHLLRRAAHRQRRRSRRPVRLAAGRRVGGIVRAGGAAARASSRRSSGSTGVLPCIA